MPAAPPSARSDRAAEAPNPTARLAGLTGALERAGLAWALEPGPAAEVPGSVSHVPGSVSDVPGSVSDVPGSVSDVPGSVSDVTVTGVTWDSRAVEPGHLFVCLRGSAHDGHDHAAEAVAAGAVALLAERRLPVAVPQVVVDDSRRAMAPVAAELWGHPSRRLAVAGVTGTNGKTTVTHLLGAVMAAAGRPAAVVGTLSQARTTPEAPALQARLAAEAAAGTEVVALEVSSHALAQHRVDATWFAVAVFTNLSHDHLDYHGTMERYFEAKASLFTPERAGVALVDVDGPWGRRLAELAGRRGLAVRRLSLDLAEGLAPAPDGATFRWRGRPVRLRLPGTHNVANALAAAAAAAELGVDPGDVAEGLSSVTAVPGRFERVDAGQAFSVVVDYAHTPAALGAALAAARALARGRVAVVFGCGGERDHEKRPAMGETAARGADLVVVTSDNPRSEDPAAIAAAVRDGAEAVAGGARVVVEPDRRAAIALALAQAGPGDVVLVAGKGHETTQTFGDGPVPFDDRQVARDELERLAG